MAPNSSAVDLRSTRFSVHPKVVIARHLGTRWSLEMGLVRLVGNNEKVDLDKVFIYSFIYIYLNFKPRQGVRAEDEP